MKSSKQRLEAINIVGEHLDKLYTSRLPPEVARHINVLLERFEQLLINAEGRHHKKGKYE